MPWATSQDIPPAVRYLWPKLFNKLVFEIVSLFIFEGGLYLSYRIIIHYILLYIIHIAVCNIHYLGWLGAPIPRKKKNQHHLRPSFNNLSQNMQITGALPTQITNTEQCSSSLHSELYVFWTSAAQQEHNTWYPSFEGYHHPQHNHIQITCLWRSGRGRWWKKNLTSAWYPAPAASRAILALNSMFHLYIIINMIPIPSLNWKTQCPSPQWFSFASPAPWCIPWKPTSPCIAHLGYAKARAAPLLLPMPTTQVNR